MMNAGPLPPHRVQRRLAVSGIVQGVGFRPYVWRLATELGLDGWVSNDGSGVVIEVRGEAEAIHRFTERLSAEAPPLARVREVRWQESGEVVASGFQICESRSEGPATTMIGPDSGVCPDCLAELFDPAERRFRYPFINCTHCGPRYTLTRALPYDRAQTSMDDFPLCPACASEYGAPADRRFHAEPTACPVCGPRLWLSDAEGNPFAVADPIAETVARLRAGAIVAVKGLGGVHLVCDARNAEAVARLRQRKQRDARPFAIMVANSASLRDWAECDTATEALLNCAERPIVLLRKRAAADAALPGV
ncbi:MAG TPA: acylphosphatase, partial [Gammaproteobacteria bacterium]